MKKIITMCMVYMMLLTCVLPCVSVFAEKPDLLFELKIDEDNGAALSLGDASGSNLVTSVEAVGSPILKTLDTGKKYLELATYDEETGKWTNNGNAEVLATFDAAKVNLVDKTAITFETWTRCNYLVKNAWDQFFELSDGTNNAVSLEIEGTYFAFYPDRVKSANATDKLKNVSGYNEKWTHYVFVRSWDSTDTKWTNTVYVNGEVKSFETSNDLKVLTERGDYSALTMNKLTIGGTAGSSKFSLRGDISTFKVYDGVLSAEDVAAKYSSEKSQYVEFPDTFSVTENSSDTDTLPIDAGKITLKFDNYVDTSTIERGITFTKGDNEPIAGGVTYETHTDAFGYVDSVTLKYGVLEAGPIYTLKVSEELKSYGKQIPCEVYEKTYEIKNLDIFEDFSGDEFVVGEKPADDTERGIVYRDDTSGENTSITSVMEENGDKFVRVNPNGIANKGADIKINFTKPLTYSLLCVDLKIRPFADEGQSQVLARELLTTGFARYNNAASCKTFKFGSMQDGTVKPGANADASSKNVVFAKEKTDENGFYDIRVLFKRDESNNVKVTVKNLNDIEATPITATVTATDEIDGGIGFMYLAHLWVSGSSGNKGNYIDLSEFHIRTIVETDVLDTDIDTLAHTDSEFSVAFTSDMKEDSLAGLEVLDKDGEKVTTEFIRYDEYSRTAYYKLGEYLDYDSYYTLSLAKLYDANLEHLAQDEITFKSSQHEAEVMSMSLKDESGKDITSLDGVETVNLSIQVYNSGESTKYFNFAMIVYDEEGRIVKMLQKPEDINAAVESGRGKNLEVESTGVTIEEGYSIKAIAWCKDAQKGAISFMQPVKLG